MRKNSDQDLKLLACSTINNYLQRSDSKGLNKNQFRNYVCLIDYVQESKTLIIEALRSLVLSVEKDKHLPEFMIEILIKNINKGENIFGNFIILMLC